MEFKYLHPLQKTSGCVTFLAQTQPKNGADTKCIVVKFAQSYSAELHHLFVKRRMAPVLLFCGSIHQSRELYRTQKVRQRVNAIVDYAHAEGFVLGDIRPPNILVGDNDDIRMVDFDWAGKDGEARYPTCRPTALITKAHDSAMIDKWFPGRG
ncbi:hypothetical protein BJ138DRAFT_1157089 [Hygrophoropsis aurantiaca]|uniref:Uncharacterized protein n=1 Tax=Hygrophoropsis aurantiaca TaxID=72124 RepID=A0ACB8A5E7_9AGAM|nr:hypothetical protein BJ138DRAFT_1157089 [Hygrophoropsis aurantiaca]